MSTAVFTSSILVVMGKGVCVYLCVFVSVCLYATHAHALYNVQIEADGYPVHERTASLGEYHSSHCKG